MSKRQEYQREYARTPARIITMRAYYANNKARRGQYQRRWKLKALYGITPEEYDQILDGQNGCCALCLSPHGKERLHIDHYHVTGVVRGLLCQACNTGLGKFKEDPDLLRRAIKYLDRRLV